mmetsp:Transcript_28798/g.92727  ORF Transcript_28798/g.92727 Transcript_28798/m.92727 type:complete len:438 (-) Transcript_28798:255-1568(-)
MHLIEAKSPQRAVANLGQCEASKGAVPYDLRVTYASVCDASAVVHLRCQGAPTLRSARRERILAFVGSHADISFENSDRLSKISFVGKISHEIRTPLNAVCGSTEMLSAHMAEAPGHLREAWDMLNSATRQVQTAVDDVLDFSSLSAGKPRLRKSSFFSVGKLLDDVARMHASVAKAKGISFTVGDVPPSSPLKVVAEDDSLSGKIDTGVGIPRNDWEAIFEDFQQARASDAIVGTGLGLAICSMLVGLRGGRIFVLECSEARGTTIRIQLEAPAGQEDTTPSPPAARPSVAVGRALVVDDMKANRVVLSNLIKRIDPQATVVTAETGQHAVALVEEARGETDKPKPFDVVFMDVHVPVLDGIGASKLITEDFPTTKIIGFTANTDDTLRTSCLDAGMCDLLLKPTTSKALARCITDVMQLKKTAKTTRRTSSPIRE